MSTEITVDIPREWWLSSNQRLHWAAKAKRTAAIRELSVDQRSQAANLEANPVDHSIALQQITPTASGSTAGGSLTG